MSSIPVNIIYNVVGSEHIVFDMPSELNLSVSLGKSTLGLEIPYPSWTDINNSILFKSL